MPSRTESEDTSNSPDDLAAPDQHSRPTQPAAVAEQGNDETRDDVVSAIDSPLRPLSKAVGQWVRISREGQDPRTTGELHSVKALLSEEGKAHLITAHANHDAIYCVCRAEEILLPLYAWCRYKHWWLSKVPDTGYLHDPGCDDYEHPDARNRRHEFRRTSAAIQTVGDRFAVNLQLPLNETFQDLAEVLATIQRGRSKPAEFRTTSLLGLLCFAFERAGLCMHDPGRTLGFSEATSRLDNVLRRMDIGDIPLSDRLFLPRLANQEGMRRLLANMWTLPQGAYMLAVGVILKAWVGEEVVELSIEAWRPHVWVSRKLWESALKHSFSAHARKAIDQNDPISKKSRLVFVARMRLRADGRCEFDHLSLIATTRDFIPAQSSYELAFLEYVAAEGRQFEKPLLDPSRGDAILLDTLHPHRCEVLGRNDRPYRDKAAKRLEKLGAEFPGGYTVWDAARGDGLPVLPAKAGGGERDA